MAIIKVFTVNGVKELQCFDNFDNVDYMTGFEDGTELFEFHADEEEL